MEVSMYCTKCGAVLDNDAKFCPVCGEEQKQVVVEENKSVQAENNGMAIAGFVCSFFIPILGWVFGGIGLSRSRKRKGKGLGFSIAAIAIATVNFIIGLVIW